MKIPVNRHYYSLVTETIDSMCQTKTAGSGDGVYVLVLFFLGGGWTTLQTKQGEVCVLVFGGIYAPVHIAKDRKENIVAVADVCNINVAQVMHLDNSSLKDLFWEHFVKAVNP